MIIHSLSNIISNDPIRTPEIYGHVHGTSCKFATEGDWEGGGVYQSSNFYYLIYLCAKSGKICNRFLQLVSIMLVTIEIKRPVPPKSLRNSDQNL